MLPLAHQCILVTRAPSQSHEFSQSLQALGAEVIEMPTIVITPPNSWADLDRAIACLADYQWLILTSVNGVENFFARLANAEKDQNSLNHLKIAVVGEKTAQALAKFGRTADLIPPDFVADSLIDCFRQRETLSAGCKILFPRVQSGGREVLVQELEKMGMTVETVAAYESACPDKIDAIALSYLNSRKVTMITFASSKTVHNFCHLLNQSAESEVWQEWIKNSKIISIGAQTSQTCKQLLGRVDAEAEVATMAGMQAMILAVASHAPSGRGE